MTPRTMKSDTRSVSWWRFGCSLLRSLVVLQQIHVLRSVSTYAVATSGSGSPLSSAAAFMTMWTQGQVYVLNAGQSVELDCEFYAETYNMFKNPVVWRKYQRQELTEINIMGNILPPFLATGRFGVAFSTSPPRYRMRLRINDLSLEDSGNYSCEVRGPRANTLGSVTHYIFIRAPVQSVYFTTSNNSTTGHHGQSNPSYNLSPSVSGYGGGHHLVAPPQLITPPSAASSSIDRHSSYSDQSHHSRSNSQTHSQVVELTFLAGIPGPVRCVAVGGYPPPEIGVQMGAPGSGGGDEDDITERISTIAHTTSLVGEPGLRVMLYRTERSTESLVLSAEDDGKTITCAGAVADIGSMSATAKLVVHHPPLVRCLPAAADLDDRNVFLQCVVRARPSLTSLYWQIDGNGTTVAEGTVKDEYWTLVMVRNDGLIETRLFMRRATLASFRQYTLFAENSIAITRIDTELTRRQSVNDAYTSLELYHLHSHQHQQHQQQQHQHRSVYGPRSPSLSSPVDSAADHDPEINDDYEIGEEMSNGGDVIRRTTSSSSSIYASIVAVSMTSPIAVWCTIVGRRSLVF